MPIKRTKQEWIVLIHQLPAKPTNLRVATWRKLQKLGAISIKNAVYILPFNDKTNEDFQWLKQEIEANGGEAVVFRADSVEGATDREIIEQFRREKDDEYSRIAADLESLTASIRKRKKTGPLAAGRLSNHEAELNKLHTELNRVAATDFFRAKSKASALNAYTHCQKMLHNLQSRTRPAKKSVSKKGHVLDSAEYQGRRWITRRHLHIDRLASAWLIKQFIDKRPRFYFVAAEETIEGGIPFDTFGAEFTHHGEDCTFETLIKRFGFTDDFALREIAEIVHDIDLKDSKFNRLEAAGLDATVSGLAKLLADDRRLLQRCVTIFDGLYAAFSETNRKRRKT